MDPLHVWKETENKFSEGGAKTWLWVWSLILARHLRPWCRRKLCVPKHTLSGSLSERVCHVWVVHCQHRDTIYC